MGQANRESVMRRTAVVFAAAFLMAACTGGEPPGPSATQTQGQTQSAAPPPNPVPTAARAVTLSWSAPLLNSDGSVLRDLAGFKIYYGQNANVMANAISITNASVSTFIVENLTPGTWYFGITAVNSQGFESQTSNMAIKTIG